MEIIALYLVVCLFFIFILSPIPHLALFFFKLARFSLCLMLCLVEWRWRRNRGEGEMKEVRLFDCGK